MFRSIAPRVRVYSTVLPLRNNFIRTALPFGQRYQSSGPVSLLCPTCSKRLPTQLPACPSCGYISPLSPDRTYHSLFNLPFEPNPFLIDTAKLKSEFRKAQAACHPDAWNSKGPHKHDIAQNLSSSINEAYQGLLRPIKRVEYVLSLNGQALGEEDKVDDLEFIEEVIETMEHLEEFGRDDIEKVKHIASTNDGMRHPAVVYLGRKLLSS
jgi:molecular chaperone HscB